MFEIEEIEMNKGRINVALIVDMHVHCPTLVVMSSIGHFGFAICKVERAVVDQGRWGPLNDISD